MVIKNTKKISDSFMENISYMDRTLPVGKSFDLIKRTIEIGERKAVLYFIDGFVKDEAMLKLMDSFMGVLLPDFQVPAQDHSSQCFLRGMYHILRLMC